MVGQTSGTTVFEFGIDESFKAYDFDAAVGRLVGLAERLGYKVDGSFDGDGEESDDFWRLSIRDNKMTTERGEIVYPSEYYTVVEQRGRGKANHGHVIPRPDGKQTSCGGVSSCSTCDEDLKWFTGLLYGGPGV